MTLNFHVINRWKQWFSLAMYRALMLLSSISVDSMTFLKDEAQKRCSWLGLCGTGQELQSWALLFGSPKCTERSCLHGRCIYSSTWQYSRSTFRADGTAAMLQKELQDSNIPNIRRGCLWHQIFRRHSIIDDVCIIGIYKRKAVSVPNVLIYLTCNSMMATNDESFSISMKRGSHLFESGFLSLLHAESDSAANIVHVKVTTSLKVVTCLPKDDHHSVPVKASRTFCLINDDVHLCIIGPKEIQAPNENLRKHSF